MKDLKAMTLDELKVHYKDIRNELAHRYAELIEEAMSFSNVLVYDPNTERIKETVDVFSNDQGEVVIAADLWQETEDDLQDEQLEGFVLVNKKDDN
jgi:hypothetical protein